ncbi:MAG TPA: hypothetical protein VFA92_05360 [Candidatus Binatia bacterium]|nr:hypothetical protein [Candidatus Binatia bacterium]
MPRVARKDLPPLGRLLAEDDGSRVQSHLCGRRWALLGMHVSRGHGMTPDAYREQFEFRDRLIYALLEQETWRRSRVPRIEPALSQVRG